eukprot:CAMPEP_0174856578 /NCGR_PEP_ID=MMETSP1114-20130205/36110_1 /TAXON_ID=312471 /ORGANISM="Neobodo designis, Strain CCAP 1951/1" /LENGTH=193 /DNA_ID=CAMNT_0016091381 /DNA_START=35 /DNA_END=616 /DNA_ORIENTATION=-
MRSTGIQRKVFELRTYDIVPQRFAEYAKLTGDLFHLRTAHSKLCGFWVTEIGGQNQVVHIWEYDSLTHRKSVREALAADTKWVSEYLGPARSMFAKQDNVLMVADDITQEKANQQMFYHLAIGRNLTTPAGNDVERCASFRTVLGGTEGLTVQLHRAGDLDTLLGGVQDSAGARDTKLLMPAPFLASHGLPWS